MRIPRTPFHIGIWAGPRYGWYPGYYPGYYLRPYCLKPYLDRPHRTPSISPGATLVLFGFAMLFVGLLGWGVFLFFSLIGAMLIIAGLYMSRSRSPRNIWDGALRNPSGVDLSSWDSSYEQARATRGNTYAPSSVVLNCPCCNQRMAPSPLGARCPQCGYVDSS